MKARHSPEAAAAAAADAAALPGAAEAAAAAAAEADPPLLATEAAAEAAAALPAKGTATDGCLFVEPSYKSSLHLLPQRHGSSIIVIMPGSRLVLTS